MASVWCAQDRLLGRHVAIKILADRFAYDEFAVRRFKREARAAARVSAHPHVVTIYDVGDLESEDAGAPPRAFMVMEYLAGGTVADALRHQAVQREDALRWVEEAGSALDHAHERGVVHRDIKPANFLLDQNKSLHVADFGIAHVQSEDTITSTGQLFGTAAYLAPEQALGHEATGASDRYALAVAAFELLTGGRPFTATHFAAQARQHIDEAPPPASLRDASLPTAVDEVLIRGMAKDPAERFPSARAFTTALAGALSPTAAAPTGRPIPRTVEIAAQAASDQRGNNPDQRSLAGTRDRPRRGGAVVLAAVAVLVLAAVVLATQLGGNPSRSPSSSTHRLAAAGARHHRTSQGPRASATSSIASQSTTAGRSSSAAATSTSAQASTTPYGSSATSTGGPDTLETAGHEQMVAGDYPAAISTLRRAVATAPSSSLTYAYALYDLGRSLYLSGDAAAAIPILERRLQIPNQTPVVQALLDQARQAIGHGTATSSSSTSSAHSPAVPAHPSGGAATPAGRSGRVPPGHRPGRGHQEG
jgi:serine/threonine-protein kinase